MRTSAAIVGTGHLLASRGIVELHFEHSKQRFL
jgi:hypothetical protein